MHANNSIGTVARRIPFWLQLSNFASQRHSTPLSRRSSVDSIEHSLPCRSLEEMRNPRPLSMAAADDDARRDLSVSGCSPPSRDSSFNGLIRFSNRRKLEVQPIIPQGFLYERLGGVLHF